MNVSMAEENRNNNQFAEDILSTQRTEPGSQLRQRVKETSAGDEISLPSADEIPEESAAGLGTTTESDNIPLQNFTVETSDDINSTKPPQRQQPPPLENTCRICYGGVEEEHDLGKLVSPCKCKGTMKYVHIG